jgi:hypothetical protein
MMSRIQKTSQKILPRAGTTIITSSNKTRRRRLIIKGGVLYKFYVDICI